MRKQKNTELNFLYMDEKQSNKKKKEKTNLKKKNATKSKKKNEGTDDFSLSPEKNMFNFDNEIVIGVTIPNANKKNQVKNKNNKITNKKKKNKNTNNLQTRKVNDKRENINTKEKNNNKQNIKKNSKKNRIIKGIIKWTILLSALVASFIYFMMSPLFNLTEIQVNNNEKINTDTIISLSNLTIGENIYKTSISKIRENIKQNAYIENVQIKRKLPNKILITVQERKTTYNLEYVNSFVYINNQGYILEISQDKLEVPIIEGYTTSEENIIVGNRLDDEDLERLGTVLKIMKSADAHEISNLITKINISDKQNYIIILDGEKKTVYLGDASNLSERMPYLKAILAEERGVEGEIFINGDLNKTNAYFRRKE